MSNSPEQKMSLQGLNPESVKHVGVMAAWPYANGPRHLGHGASLLPADTVARYQRAIGNEVLMVSGTDEYGTPNVIAAEKAGREVSEYVDEVNSMICDDFKSLGMSFDWFTRTTTETHTEIAQYLFEQLAANGYLEKGTMLGSFDSVTGQSLPDRYIEGGCPTCGVGTRGDQCENCNTLLDPVDLSDPRSSLTSNSVEFRDTEHWFLMLDRLAPQLRDWLANHEDLRPNAKKSSLKQVEELRPRAITRDMEWGVPLPKGYELKGDSSKVLYVWFDAVTGYLSASIEWAANQGDPDLWKKWWQNEKAHHIYAMGKDNVPFHTIIWPAILKGVSQGEDEPLHLPDQIASTEYLTLGEQKFSSSRGNTIYLRDLIRIVGADAVRFYMLHSGPETHDKIFNLDEFTSVMNEQLLSKWGNMVQRITKLLDTGFDSRIPETNTKELRTGSRKLLDSVQKGYDEVGELINQARFSAAAKYILELCSNTNRYINQEEPWKTVKSDRISAAQSLFTSAVAIDNISRMFTPFIPHSSQRVHELLGYNENIAGDIYTARLADGTKVLTGDYSGTKNTWRYVTLPQGQQIRPAEHLFKKLDAKEIAISLKASE